LNAGLPNALREVSLSSTFAIGGCTGVEAQILRARLEAPCGPLGRLFTGLADPAAFFLLQQRRGRYPVLAKTPPATTKRAQKKTVAGRGKGGGRRSGGTFVPVHSPGSGTIKNKYIEPGASERSSLSTTNGMPKLQLRHPLPVIYRRHWKIVKLVVRNVIIRSTLRNEK